MISGENRVTWKDDIRRALSEIGRDATTSEIYERVEKNRETEGRSTTTHSRSLVRRVLEKYGVESDEYSEHTDIFLKVYTKTGTHWRLK